MFDLGWTELLLIGIVALIVVGPNDLPGLFRSVGRFMGKMRGMAREFSSAMNAAADEAGVKDIEKTIRSAANPAKAAAEGIKNSVSSQLDPNTETGRLSAERKAQVEKIREHSAKVAEERIAREKAAEAAKAEAPAPAKDAE